MRGSDINNESLFTTVRLGSFVPGTHPLQVLYSERQLLEQVQCNLRFRWFVGLAIEHSVWNPLVSSMKRDRLIEHHAVTKLFNSTVAVAEQRGLLSGEHVRVDGALIQAWSRCKSMRRKDGSHHGRPPKDWHKESRHNATHKSKSDPQAHLCRTSNAASARPSRLGDDLAVNVQASTSDGTAERDRAAQMLGDVAGPGERLTLGAGKASDTHGFVKACRDLNVTRHVAHNVKRADGCVMGRAGALWSI